jgi:hypothetical protein
MEGFEIMTDIDIPATMKKYLDKVYPCQVVLKEVGDVVIEIFL